MDIDQFLGLIKKRRSMRLFKPDPVPDESIEKILECARWSMSGANGQPWEFIVVKEPDTRGRIVDIMTEQLKRSRPIEMTRLEEIRMPQLAEPVEGKVGIKNAPVIIVVCGDPRTYQATVLAHQFYSSEYDNFHMSLGNTTMIMHLAAAALGLGSRWVTVNRPWEEDIKRLLDVPKEFRIYMIVPIGYQAYDPPPTYRRDLDEIVHHENYDWGKYRNDEDIIKFLVKLRQKTRPAYSIERKKGK